MKVAVIFPAAGRSRRFQAGLAGRSVNKLEVDLGGKPVFLRAMEPFLKHEAVRQCILATDPQQLDVFKDKWADKLGFLGVRIVGGGEIERWETIRNALAWVDEDCTHIAVHDAARPLLDGALLDRLLQAAKCYPAVIPGVPIHATLKRTAALASHEQVVETDPLDAIFGQAGKSVLEVRKVSETVNRQNVVEVQTPQIFERALLQQAYEAIESKQISTGDITDDAGLVEAMGACVYVVPGDPCNLKITQSEDMDLARVMIAHRQAAQARSQPAKRLFADDDED